MIKFIFVRHGQTEWNLIHKLQGSLDSPLTPTGISQALKLHEKLKKDSTNFSYIYSSPLGRAYHTAQLITNNLSNVRTIPEFQELNLGKMEGMDYQTFEATHPIEYFDFFYQPEKYNPTALNGESFTDLLLRIKKGIDYLLSVHKDGDTVIVVTHGITLRGIGSYLSSKSLSLENFSKYPVPENTSITTATYFNGHFDVLDFSNIEHLNQK